MRGKKSKQKSEYWQIIVWAGKRMDKGAIGWHLAKKRTFRKFSDIEKILQDIRIFATNK